jgi:hypothetical protein
VIVSDKERADYYYQREQEARFAIRQRTEHLFEKARRQVDLRIWSYSKNMRRHYQAIVEQMHRDMCNEDLIRQGLIEDQEQFLRLATGYQQRHLRSLLEPRSGIREQSSPEPTTTNS